MCVYIYCFIFMFNFISGTYEPQYFHPKASIGYD